MGEAVHGSAPQPRGAGAGEPRDPEARSCGLRRRSLARGAEVVPLHVGRIGGDDGHADRRLAHGLHGRARLRGLVPSERRRGRLGRDLGGRRAARHEAARARGARHPPDRGRADLRRLRVRRRGRPVRGRHRLHGRPATKRGGLRRPRGARGARRSTRSACSSVWSSRETSRPATATACLRRAPAGRRRHQRNALADAAEEHCLVPNGGRSSRSSGRRVEVGKLDGLQKRIPAHRRPLPVLRPREDTPRS